MNIRNLDAHDSVAIEQAAVALVEGFREHWPDAWPDLESAREEVAEALEDGKICRAAFAETGELLGWIGGQHSYALVWELHPLVVVPNMQQHGVGRALVADLVEQVRSHGGLTLMLGSDDQDDMTSLSGVDLYPNIPQHLGQVRNLRRHPFEFYQKCGFSIIGVVPDANGFGKPDILMAMRV